MAQNYYLQIKQYFILYITQEADTGPPLKESDLPPLERVEFPEDAYHMVTQLAWENDVIWNGEEARSKVLQTAAVKGAVAGWLPSPGSRSADQYIQQSEYSIYNRWSTVCTAERVQYIQ